MIKKLKLETLPYVCFDDVSPFILTENDDLTICFTSSKYDLSDAYIRLKNGVVKKVFAIDKETFSLTLKKESGLLQVGVLEISVELPNVGKKWLVDGLQIKVLDELQLSVTTFYNALQSQIDELKKDVEKLKNDKSNIFNI
jgi:hypothetical protein